MSPSIRADPAARTLHVDAATMRVRSVITTIDPDRAGDVVVPTGLQNREEFLLNPVVLWAHDRIRVPPIGVCEWLDVQPRRIVAETRFAHGVPFAEDLFRLYEQNVLRGWSIGFVPRQASRVPRGDGGTSLRVFEWDLLEYSAVPIPENPGALTIAIQKGWIRDRTLRDWLVQVPDERGRRYFRAFDVLSELVEAPSDV
ncbi:MAG: HK97 family phage prohead protease [Gemmataceae bacterium]|nr:HK97 family phage prohead protease [Gemmata sp.]MDW8199566.1 HK97 family phage prohead protease [Gemmataceae bacterium]